MGGGYITMSGTSMAAPYVTSVAAIVRQLHPEWSAFEIRDAMITATEDLGSSIFSQGKGKLDISKIAGVGSFATPATLSFGFDNSSTAEWTQIDTISFTNVSPLSRTYTFKNFSSYGGIDLQISPSTATLSSNETKSIVVEVGINNSLLPDNTVLPQGYSGKILAISNSDTVTVPYVFFKGTVFQLSFSETPFQVVIHDQKSNSYYFNPTNSFLTAIVPAGTYDIITAFSGSAYVVKENLNTQDNVEISIDRDQANHVVTVLPTDENGEALAPVGTNTSSSYVEALMHNSSGISEVLLGGGKVQTASLVQTMYFSDVSSNYSFGYAINVQYGNLKSYTFDVELDSGITSSQSCSVFSVRS